MDQENGSIHRMEYYLTIERNKVQTVSDFQWFDLQFFNFMVVLGQYALVEVHNNQDSFVNQIF